MNSNNFKHNLSLELTEEEDKVVDCLVSEINVKCETKVTKEIAVRFMRAKKFNLSAATDLYIRHSLMRSKENLVDINPTDKDVLMELLSEKFTFMLKPDLKSGASICIFTAKLHFPSRTTHQNTLKALLFQLDAALSNVSAQKNGLIFVYNMTGSLYSNFDFQLSVKILNLLKGAYPARLSKVIIYTPPLWFRASFNFLRLFVREKLQDRICIVTSTTELHRLLPASCLPASLAGTCDHRHRVWLSLAFENMGYSPGVVGSLIVVNGGSLLTNEKACDQSMEELSPDSGVMSSLPDGVVGATIGATGDEERDHEDDEYELLSISSWEFNLDPSGDEDAICSGSEDNGTTTPANLTCASPRTPVPAVALQRRNAVREERCGTSGSSKRVCSSGSRRSRPSWSLYRPGEDASVDLSTTTKSLHDRDNDIDGCDSVTIDHFANSEDHSFYSTLNEFRSDSVYGDAPQFTSYSQPINVMKNRYSDIQCTELSRVRLVRSINWPEPTPTAPQADQSVNIVPSEILSPHQSIVPTDYIHANWADGYRQKNAYICSQGPLYTTVSDFWHMIVQYRIPIIVMTTRPREQNRDKCLQYWPEEVGTSKILPGINGHFDSFEVTNLRNKEFGPHCPEHGECGSPDQHWYRVTLLHVKNLRTGQEHRVNHFYFHSWPDQGIPHSSEGFLQFILQIRHTYRLNIAKLGYDNEFDQSVPPPPILVHCSAGIGRTGTYIVTEICCKSLSDCGRFNLHSTMLKVRSQRHKCVQNAYQYLFCRNTIIDYARQFGLLPPSPHSPPPENEDDLNLLAGARHTDRRSTSSSEYEEEDVAVIDESELLEEQYDDPEEQEPVLPLPDRTYVASTSDEVIDEPALQ